MERSGLGALMGFVCTVLVGCGGEPGNVDLSPAASADQQLLAFLTADGTLKTFDPLTPTVAALTVDTGVTQALPVLAGTYRFSDNSLADPHYPLLLYIKQGKVYRLDLRPAASRTPVQVSSIANACRFSGGFSDFANIENSRVMVRRQDADPDCTTIDDNSAGYFRINAASGTAPTSVTVDVLPADGIYDSTGALGGVLASTGLSNARKLQRFNASLQSPQLVTDLASTTGVDFSGPEPTGDIFYLRLTKPSNSNCLHRYLASSNQLSDCLHAYANTSEKLGQTSQADAGYIYYADNNLVRRLGHGSTAPAALYNPTGGYVIKELRLSLGRVVLAGSRNAGNPYFVESVPSGTGVTAFLGSGSNRLDIAAVTSNHVYFSDETAITATAIRDDGSTEGVLSNSGWGGFSFPTGRISLGALDGYRDAYHGVYGTAAGNGVVTIRSFNAQTSAIIAVLGTVPDAISSTTTAIGRYRLETVRVYRTATRLTDTDVYFADTLTPNSLLPLAATSGGDDRSVY